MGRNRRKGVYVVDPTLKPYVLEYMQRQVAAATAQGVPPKFDADACALTLPQHYARQKQQQLLKTVSAGAYRIFTHALVMACAHGGSSTRLSYGLRSHG